MKPIQAQKTSSAFRQHCSVEATIRARPEVIWRLLTDAAGFPSWNSTVTRIEGEIALGQRLALEVPSAPGRVFRPRVAHVEAARSMVWQDGVAPMFRGVRTFKLAPNADGTTRFAMDEEFSGLMLPPHQRFTAGLRAGVRTLRGRPEASGGSRVMNGARTT